MHKTNGFTLVELSIVLVIIGLITGGVLVGQDMIKNAQIKSQVTQIEDYNTALNTFVLKYNWIPGDCGDECGPAGFNLVPFATFSPSAYIHDGYIYGRFSDATSTIHEASGTMSMLVGAGFISGPIGGAEFPQTIMERGTIALQTDRAKKTYWVVGKADGVGNVYASAGSTFTAFELWKIDSILDDANPSAGSIRVADEARGILYSNSGVIAALPLDHNDLRYNGAASGSVDADCVDEASGGATTNTADTYEFANDEDKDCPFVVRTSF